MAFFVCLWAFVGRAVKIAHVISLLVNQRCLVWCLAGALFAISAARAAAGDPVVGAYYYPWYGSFSGGHSVNQSLRGHLMPPQPPVLRRTIAAAAAKQSPRTLTRVIAATSTFGHSAGGDRSRQKTRQSAIRF